MKRKNFIGLNVGSSSILLIFIVLCLVSLAVLSLTGSAADLRLSKKVAERQISYYRACNDAEKDLAIYDQQFEELASSLSQTAYFNQVEESYTNLYPITEIQTLVVTIKPQYNLSTQNHYYTITQWQTVITNEPDYDTSLHVYQ